MVEGLRWKFTIILLLAVVGIYVVLPPSILSNKPILKDVKYNLGIDLQGGAELRYRLLYDAKKDEDPHKLLPEAISVINLRVNSRGLKEPLITSHGDDEVIVQLAGVDAEGIKEYKELMRKIGKLELYEVASKETHEQYSGEGKEPPLGYKWILNDDIDRRARDSHMKGPRILIKDSPIVTGKHIVQNGTEPRSEFGGWYISFALNDEGARLFEEATKRLAQKGYIAIVLDGKLESAPFVQSAISKEGKITGNYTKDEATRLAIILRSGNLPAPLGKRIGNQDIVGEPESETFVGSTLGADAQKRGWMAIYVAFGLVMAFMLIYYRGGGVVAVLAVLLNLVFLLFSMAVLGATLTLPGIAGIILTVGMAVDGNILILERIREEKDKGKSTVQAFESAYQRVYLTIMDANITTLVAAIVLYFFGTGPVQGFAVTLTIGIITTLFTVTFCTKVITRMFLLGGLIKDFSMMRMLQKPNINFIRIAGPMVILSVILIVLSIFFFFKDTSSILGLDFTGGTMLTMDFGNGNSQEIAHIRKTIAEIPRSRPDNPAPKYTGVIVQPVFKAEQGLIPGGQTKSEVFQIRVGKDLERDVEALRMDFNNILSHQTDREKIKAEFLAAIGRRGNLGSLKDDFVKIVARAQTVDQINSDTLVLLSRQASPDQIKQDFIDAFKLETARPPFEDLPAGMEEVNPGDAFNKGSGFLLNLSETPAHLATFEKKIADAVKEFVGVDPNDPDKKPLIKVTKVDAMSTQNRLVLRILITEKDAPKLKQVREAIESKASLPLTKDPFTQVGVIGPQVVKELTSSTVQALIWSWVLIIIYVGYRFTSWKFGVVAVLALIHDAIITTGAVAVCSHLVSRELGLNFEINLNTVAAVLTIIGYSVNDTIVTFDRIRENLPVMKRESFRDIINTSVNQTLSRTILTSLTVWLSVIALYILTLKGGTGIETFAFPMVVGTIIGTYSTIYIAGPLLVWWYKKGKPQAKSV